MEYSIQELARAAGVTSRTLRHYGDVGLLEPARIGANGYRYYSQDGLLRLQRILLLRELGLGLPAIAEVLTGQTEPTAALEHHLHLLENEAERLSRLIGSVRTTLTKTKNGVDLMASEALDGFDHTKYRDEVEERWGPEAYRRADAWWRSLTPAERAAHQQNQLDIAADYGRAAAAGWSPGSDEVQAITARQVEWLAAAADGSTPSAEYLTGLGEMYVADPRFRANYERHGVGTAELIRDALAVYAQQPPKG